jgi:hypothetical protein
LSIVLREEQKASLGKVLLQLHRLHVGEAGRRNDHDFDRFEIPIEKVQFLKRSTGQYAEAGKLQKLPVSPAPSGIRQKKQDGAGGLQLFSAWLSRPGHHRLTAILVANGTTPW